jgi:hypothetical protein
LNLVAILADTKCNVLPAGSFSPQEREKPPTQLQNKNTNANNKTSAANAKKPAKSGGGDNIIARVCEELLPRLQSKSLTASLTHTGTLPNRSANNSSNNTNTATTTTSSTLMNANSVVLSPSVLSSSASFLRQFLEAIVAVGRIKPIHFHSTHQVTAVTATLLLLLAENKSHVESLTCVLRALSFVLLENGARCEQFEVIVQTLAPLISLTGMISRYSIILFFFQLFYSLFFFFFFFPILQFSLCRECGCHQTRYELFGKYLQQS